MLMEGERPSLCDPVIAGGQTPVRADLRQPWPGEVDDAHVAHDLDPRASPCGEIWEGDDVQTQVAAERLDERTGVVATGVECAELTRRSIEAVAVGCVEVFRGEGKRIDANP